MVKIDLSIIILSFNTREVLHNCLLSLDKVKNEGNFEIIVSDNGSGDGSVEMVKKEFPEITLIENKENLGFAAGNNAARNYVKGENVLFLNSDTLVPKGTLAKSLEYLRQYKDVGALSCKTILPNGKLDRDARRSFPTPWVAFTHFTYLDRLFPKSTLFARYWYGYIPPSQTHEIEALQGAFCLVRRKILEDINWFSEDYFLDGEDIDLSWKIRNKGWKLIYYPEISITHIKKASKRKTKNLKFVLAGINSMEIFYKKRLWKNYSIIVNGLVILAIQLMKLVRIIKTFFS